MLLTPFLHQCQQQPDALALQEQDRQISYRQLLQRAQFIAAALQAKGIQSGQPVAIHLDRGIDAASALFGVLLSGACYVPLDLKNPVARLSFIVADARVRVVIGSGGGAPAWLDDSLWLDIASCSEAIPAPVEISAESLAAILYTSGSTGQPRGVALSHRAISAFALWAADLLALTPADRIASSAPFFFDLSTFDLYAVLGTGASLHFVPSGLTMAPARLSAWLSEQAISGWYTVPSLLAFLTYKGNLAQTRLAALRFLIFAGEVFPTPALIDLAASLPQTALYNFFGPTETNVCCYWPVMRERLIAEQTIPIGLPAAGCELQIDAESGELWVRGPTLASGYWSDGRVQPFFNADGWYATGDRASLEQGEFRFHGRLGRMLKCSGYRVEPAEIEAVVNTIPGVKGCAVIGMDDPTAGQRPALAVVLEPDMTIGEIRKTLSRQLPAYMQPSRYLDLEDLPRLANGKLDYNQIRVLLES
ncbi:MULTISPECIES: amino acid adenylation domain-containing protein [Methylomonas]|uniref:Phenylalanine racemase n=1 Tax=Methylomonas denitrificans TaxID=1538553 RepID=A0A140E6U0_9GAMM|nr:MULTISPECIES: amino acid adenylation domain-containing protein [Methylomonas]AMK79114.1 phenylalanine racemase [Methylomonas denitrificans]OAH99619.1 phenylalanine racemase [Methylomonas methanica]